LDPEPDWIWISKRPKKKRKSEEMQDFFFVGLHSFVVRQKKNM
jgi:hypothetical protein